MLTLHDALYHWERMSEILELRLNDEGLIGSTVSDRREEEGRREK